MHACVRESVTHTRLTNELLRMQNICCAWPFIVNVVQNDFWILAFIWLRNVSRIQHATTSLKKTHTIISNQRKSIEFFLQILYSDYDVLSERWRWQSTRTLVVVMNETKSNEFVFAFTFPISFWYVPPQIRFNSHFHCKNWPKKYPHSIAAFSDHIKWKNDIFNYYLIGEIFCFGYVFVWNIHFMHSFSFCLVHCGFFFRGSTSTADFVFFSWIKFYS